MSFRFRKKIKIAPGVSINLNKSTFGIGKGNGASVTLGAPGLGVNINRKGIEGFAGINGTGIGWRTGRFGGISAASDIANADELQTMDFDEGFCTTHNVALSFIKSFLSTFCFVLMISLLVSIFIEYHFNEILVVSIWLLVPLLVGWSFASSVNDDAEQCECGSFEFTIKKIECLSEDHLYLNKNGSADKRKKYNPVVTTSLVGTQCQHCHRVTNQKQIMHL